MVAVLAWSSSTRPPCPRYHPDPDLTLPALHFSQTLFGARRLLAASFRLLLALRVGAARLAYLGPCCKWTVERKPSSAPLWNNFARGFRGDSRPGTSWKEQPSRPSRVTPCSMAAILTGSLRCQLLAWRNEYGRSFNLRSCPFVGWSVLR